MVRMSACMVIVVLGLISPKCLSKPVRALWPTAGVRAVHQLTCDLLCPIQESATKNNRDLVCALWGSAKAAVCVWWARAEWVHRMCALYHL